MAHLNLAQCEPESVPHLASLRTRFPSFRALLVHFPRMPFAIDIDHGSGAMRYNSIRYFVVLGIVTCFAVLGSADDGLAEKAAVVQMLSQQTKANYDKLQTWEGSYSYRAQWQVEGDAAKAYFDAAKSNPSANQLPLTNVSSSTARFAIDFATDSLFSTFEADRPAEVRLRTGELLTVPNIVVTNVMSISTPEHYLHFMPTVNQTALSDFPKVTLERGVGRMAYREPSRTGKTGPWGAVFDPRFLFGFEMSPVHVWLGGLSSVATNASPEQKRELDNSLDVKKEHPGDDSVYTIVIGRSQEREITFDGKVGFNLVKLRVKEQGGWLRREQSWEYQRIDDIYIPAKVQFLEYGDDGNIVVDRNVVLRECSVNKPIAPNVFSYDQFGLKNGERVLDKIEGGLFVYQDGNLVNAKDMPPPRD